MSSEQLQQPVEVFKRKKIRLLPRPLQKFCISMHGSNHADVVVLNESEVVVEAANAVEAVKKLRAFFRQQIFTARPAHEDGIEEFDKWL